MNLTRGYNAVELFRAGQEFPNNLAPAALEPEMALDAFFAQLEAAGVNKLRVKLYDPAEWIAQAAPIVEAARAHGVRFHVVAFGNEEFTRGWGANVWNVCNGGWLVNANSAFTEQRAIAAAQARIVAICEALGDTVGAWELCAEMGSGLCTPEFLGASGWNDEYTSRVRSILVQWVETMAEYVHSVHHAPVGNGQIFAPKGLGRFPGDVRNEPFCAPSLDFALINWYGGTLTDQLVWLRACQEYCKIPVRIEQYAPWIPRPEVPAPYDAPEPEPYTLSKAREWAALCGELGGYALRWPEIRPRGNWRAWYGTASPQMSEIAGVTWEFAQHVGLDGWVGRGWAYDDGIKGDGLQLVSSWGDGRHVTAFATWDSDGDKALTVYGLNDGNYSARVFDWITGQQVANDTAVAAHGALDLVNLPAFDGALALCVSPVVPVPEPPSDTPRIVLAVHDMETGAHRAIELEVGKQYALEVEAMG